MKKDFDTWNVVKKKTNVEHPRLYTVREIWWCRLGVNVGVEADGKKDLFERPVLVFRKFNKEMFWGLPMTSQEKDKRPFHFSVSLHDQEQVVVLSQLRVLSSKRLIRRLTKISDSQFDLLNKALESYLKQTDPLRGPQVPNGNK